MNYKFEGTALLAGRSGVEDRVAFLRSVYLWLMGGFLVAGVGAWVSFPIASYLSGIFGRFTGWAFFGVQFGSLLWASAVSRRKPLNKIAYGVFTFISGVMIGVVATYYAQTSGLGTVIAAFGMTAADFLLLTVIAFVKKDFSFLRSFVAIGVGIMFFGMLISAIFHLETLGLIAAGVAVIACSAKILYDTSNMLRTGDTSDPAGFALSLFVSLYNILLSLMRLLGGRRS